MHVSDEDVLCELLQDDFTDISVNECTDDNGIKLS
jgi:hypothetical protein